MVWAALSPKWCGSPASICSGRACAIIRHTYEYVLRLIERPSLSKNPLPYDVPTATLLLTISTARGWQLASRELRACDPADEGPIR